MNNLTFGNRTTQYYETLCSGAPAGEGFDGVAGVEPQTETVWRQANKYNVPRMCFVNKMDRIGADFKMTFNQIITKLEANPVAIQIPIGAEDQFVGVIDLIKMKSITYKDETMGADYIVSEIPADMLENPAEPEAAAARGRRRGTPATPEGPPARSSPCWCRASSRW